MKERAYYLDSYTTRFNATVVEHLLVEGRQAVVLDQTYFYPTSGGQPFDKGHINEVAIFEVLVRPVDGVVLHVLESEIDRDQIIGVIDWQRRLDHMQHHTGQHILSQAFIRIAGANTIGFHLSDSTATIDLDKRVLTETQIEAVEQLVNEIIWQDRTVEMRMVTTEEAITLSLRKIPETHNERLRLIEIKDFDLTACGGTHVARTGEIGLMKIVKQERRGEKQRIEFRCAQRALSDYGQKHQIATQLSAQLTTGTTELVAAVARLQDEQKQARRQLRSQQTELDRIEAKQLLDQGRRYKDVTLIAHVFSGRDPGKVRALGGQLVRNDGVVALFGLAGNRSHLIFSRAEGAPGNMNTLLRFALNELGSQSGGGSDSFAQGVGPSADITRLQRVVSAAENQFLEELGRLG